MKYVEDLEDIFDIKHLGLVVAPGIPYSFSPPTQVGDDIEFRNPSGSIIKTKIKSFLMLNRGKKMEHLPFSVERNFEKTEVEAGAKYYMSGAG